MLLKISFLFLLPLFQLWADAQPTHLCKMTPAHSHNADNADIAFTHMRFLDNKRTIDFFFATHPDPEQSYLADFQSLFNDHNAAVDYVREVVSEDNNQTLAEGFRRDKEYYMQYFRNNREQLRWIGMEGADIYSNNPLDASRSFQNDRAITARLHWNLMALNLQSDTTTKLTKEQIDDFVLLTMGPYLAAQLALKEELSGLDMRFTDNPDKFRRSHEILSQMNEPEISNLRETAQRLCADLLSGKVAQASPECAGAFRAFQAAMDPLQQQFTQAQNDRDVALVDVVAGFEGNGALFRGGDHQAEVTRLMEERCLQQSLQQGSDQGSEPSHR